MLHKTKTYLHGSEFGYRARSTKHPMLYVIHSFRAPNFKKINCFGCFNLLRFELEIYQQENNLPAGRTNRNKINIKLKCERTYVGK